MTNSSVSCFTGSRDDLKHLNPSCETEALVTELFSRGLKNHRIRHEVNSLWSTQSEADSGRIALTLENIRNLRKKYNAKNQIHPQDNVALHLLVERTPTDIIIYYAWRDGVIPGKTQPRFCSIIMADSGVQALREWGTDIAFMDTTFGVTRYGYCFTVLVVKDSHSNHWPVAFMFHYDETTAVFTTFLTEVKKRGGMLPKIIMTDISAAGKSTITNEYSL
jgi:hypothetical protein